jgi:anti-sigma factor ChrR (cupin superfamily)
MNHELPEIELQERAFLSAIGALSAEEQLAFEQHLNEGCDVCAAELRMQQEVCAHLTLAAAVVEPSPTVKDKLLRRIASEKQANNQKQAETNDDATKFFTLHVEDVAWQMLSEGVYVKQLYVDRKKRIVTSLYKMEPGAKVPTHVHADTEECFVIEGDFYVNDLKLGPGDYHRAEAGSVHRKLRTETGNLLLIIAPQD